MVLSGSEYHTNSWQQKVKCPTLRRPFRLRISVGIAAVCPHYTARLIHRAVRHLIEDPLSVEALPGRFGGGDTIVAGLDTMQ
jgi:hypothetical protein